MISLHRGSAFVFWNLLSAATLAVGLATLTPLRADKNLYCELASHFQMQYVLLLALFTIIFAIGNCRRLTAIALIITAAAFCVHILPLYISTLPKPTKPRSLRLISSNIFFKNEETEPLFTWIKAENPDIVVLYEITRAWESHLTPLKDSYPHHKWVPSAGHSGIGVFSRLPLNQAELIHLGDSSSSSPAWVVKLKVNECPITLIAAHPDPPVSRKYITLRNAQLDKLAQEILKHPHPIIVLGDLNTSSWNPCFSRLESATGLHDTRRGFGVQPTWSPFVWAPHVGKTNLSFLRFFGRSPIDHCLVTDEFRVLDRRVGPDIGSDHLPILIDLAIEKPEKAAAN